MVVAQWGYYAHAHRNRNPRGHLSLFKGLSVVGVVLYWAFTVCLFILSIMLLSVDSFSPRYETSTFYKLILSIVQVIFPYFSLYLVSDEIITLSVFLLLISIGLMIAGAFFMNDLLKYSQSTILAIDRGTAVRSAKRLSVFIYVFAGIVIFVSTLSFIYILTVYPLPLEAEYFYDSPLSK